MAKENRQYEELANAIVVEACKDYRRALRKLEKKPRDKESLSTKRDCEKFFKGKWFKSLTNLDGQKLMEMLRKSVAD